MYEQRSWSDKWVALESCKSGEILVSAIYKPTLPSRSSSTRFWFLYFSIHVFTVHLYNLFESDGNCIKAVVNLLMSCYADRLVLCWSVESWPSLSSRPGELSKRIAELNAQDEIKGRRYTMAALNISNPLQGTSRRTDFGARLTRTSFLPLATRKLSLELLATPRY